MDELTRRALVDKVDNVIADYNARELSDTDIEGLNGEELSCIMECLQYGQAKCLESKEFDFDKMIETIHNAPISFGYIYDGIIQIKEPSYIITQEHMIELFNYVKSVN